MKTTIYHRLLLVTFVVLVTLIEFVPAAEKAPEQRPILLAHYMPWYVAKPYSQVWGWHWTMNTFDPDQLTNNLPEIASQYHPLIGPYDSGDPLVLEYQLLTMKLAGIDGIIVDWYGLEDFRDYALLHRNTQAVVNEAQKLGLRFAICYEDQTIPALVEEENLPAEERIQHAVKELTWMNEHWLSEPAYVQENHQPLVLSFGQSGLTTEEWSQVLDQVNFEVAYYSQHFRREAAQGAFDWPVPSTGLAAVQQFQERAQQWPAAIPVVFPRFHDIYVEAKVHESWGHIPDRNGRTFQQTLQQALETHPTFIQIATWNDWGEGTVIEPSVEFGYRDLEQLQRVRRQSIESDFHFTGEDLKLPLRLYEFRNILTTDDQRQQLDEIRTLLAKGRTFRAKRLLDEIDQTIGIPR